MELLVVIGIIALVGSLGAGAYQAANRRYSLSSSAGRIQNILRAARNTSVSTQIPSYVVIDPTQHTVTGYAFKRSGAWSFDEVTEKGEAVAGAGEANYGAQPCEGRVGKGLEFSRGSYYDCGSLSPYNLREALWIEAWVRHGFVQRPKKGADDLLLKTSNESGRRSVGSGRTSKRSGRKSTRTSGRKSSRRESTSARAKAEKAAAIVQKEGSYFLGMTPSGALEAGIGAHRVRTAPGVVVAERWVHVALRYDGNDLELIVDGVPRPAREGGAGRVDRKLTKRGSSRKAKRAVAEREALPATVPLTTTSLTISAPRDGFTGCIDEVKLSGCIEPEIYRYSEFEHIIGWKKIVRFDRRGHLDQRYHADDVSLCLVELPEVEKDNRRTTVAVRFDITFEEWLASFGSPVGFRQAEEEAKIEATYASERKVRLTVDRLGVVQ